MGGDGAYRLGSTSSSLSEASPPIWPLTLLFPPTLVPTVRSPPGLAKTPLSALGLKPHNPADILLHPVGGECRVGTVGGWLSLGGICEDTSWVEAPSDGECTSSSVLGPGHCRDLPVGIWGCRVVDIISGMASLDAEGLCGAGKVWGSSLPSVCSCCKAVLP